MADKYIIKYINLNFELMLYYNLLLFVRFVLYLISLLLDTHLVELKLEGLSLVYVESMNGSLLGCRVHKWCSSVSHLFLTDDSILFCNLLIGTRTASKRYCKLMKMLLGMVYFNKLAMLLFSPNVLWSSKAEMGDILQVKVVSDLRRYLRLPSHFLGNKCWDLRFLKEKVQKVIAS